ncbi:hypothetical protein [Streptomyces jumonjinensis]|uniref:Uncharacterized protein n=1 Tax=Streptomyces jumonjinensis TaxID=1945 RepID=A0A646KSX7_STRJU|nr:hypothetical protein [Streptomyces jumonjinensis]MQT05353.1 hypothetical protein [Streptomyces jumonjinensis]
MSEGPTRGHHQNGSGAPRPAPEEEAAAPGPPGPPERSEQPELGIEDILRALSARTAQPGTTDERLDAERDARSSFSRFAQSRISGERVYGGDHIEVVLGQGSRSVRAYQLPAQDIDLALSAFLPPANYPSILRAAESLRVVLVSGAPGHGKYAVAQRLLLDLHHTTLQCLEPGADLGLLEEKSLHPGHGYLLQDRAPGGAAGALSGFELQRLNTVMRAKGCRLIVTLSDGLGPGDPELDRQTFAVQGPPAPRDVFAKHLRWWLGPGRAGRADELLGAPETAVLHTEPSGADTPLGRVAENARLLSRSSGTPAEAVREVGDQASLRDTQEFEKWFNGLADPQTQCLALATAVFGGEAYETVAALAGSLVRCLQPPPTAAHPDRPRHQAFTATRAARLRQVSATLVSESVASRHGGAPARVVRFLDPSMASRVLRTVWDEYDDLRHELPGWLKKCAGHELATVRTRAAVAVGFLAGLSFDSLRTGVLQPWAGSPLAVQREAAATALVMAAENPELAQPVGDLVHAWADGTAPFRATSARAWSVLRRPGEQHDEAVALLHTLADTDRAEVMEAVCLGVTDSLAGSDHAETRDVLDLLRQWVSTRNPRRRAVGQLAFLFSAADLLEDAPAAAGNATRRRWPRLLALAAHDPVRQRDVARLWDAVLHSRESYTAACQVLTEWARAVDADPSGRRALARLLHASASTPLGRRIVLRHVATWHDTDSRATRTAAHILSHFESEGTAR